MTFVNELIPEEDKRKIDFSVITRPGAYQNPIELYDWTVDRERNAFLIWTKGGNEEEPKAIFFTLSWNGNLIKIKMTHESVGEITTELRSTWHLLELSIPLPLQSQRDDIIEMLKEALTVYKVGGIGVPVFSHVAQFKF